LEAKVSERKPSRWLYLLTAGVLLLGTLLVAVGTRNDDSTQPNDGRQNSRLAEVCWSPAGTPGLVERGAAVQRLQCAGCHAAGQREIGPSYAAIAERYHRRPIELSVAIGHPKPGWADYPPGPAGPPLARDDQAALVYWILNTGGSGDE
jgi:cytochrome c551/c552